MKFISSADCKVSICILPTTPSGSGVSVQVHRPVSHPVLESHLRDGGGAVQSEHPRALPVNPLCPELGQPQLREPGVYTGQIAHTSLFQHLLLLMLLVICMAVFIFGCSCFYYFIHSLNLHSYFIDRFLFVNYFLFHPCFTLHSVYSVIDASIPHPLAPHCYPFFGLISDSLGV